MNYKEILVNVLRYGKPKQAVRFSEDGTVIPVENGTIGTFCEIFRHDMSEGFPITSLRKVAYKSTWVELEGFIQGITDKSWYQERKCKFWDHWANPLLVKDHRYIEEFSYDDTMSKEEADAEWDDRVKAAKRDVKDLGPIYGYQWRNFNKTYTNCQSEDDGDWNNYSDQLKSIVDKLKTNPYDRRMVCSAWNPNQLDMMALPPCHYGFTVVVYGNKLNLCWKQRSCDLILGVPHNIVSYATLLLLLCKESGLQPGELVGILEDCHIYDNLISRSFELSKKDELELPEVKILPEEGEFDIFKWTHKDIILEGYEHHGEMNMGKVTV